MNSSSESLQFDGVLPAAFQIIDEFPADEQLLTSNEQNERFLKTCLLPQERMDSEELDEVGVELRRQDLKLNLLLDMMGQLLLQQNKLPEEVSLKLTSSSLICDCVDAQIKENQLLKLELYFMSSVIPRPLILFGKVAQVDDARMEIKFLGLSQTVRDWLEKVIFRHHRRAIAQGLTKK